MGQFGVAMELGILGCMGILSGLTTSTEHPGRDPNSDS